MTDAAMLASAERRRCPATGKTVKESFEEERAHLAPLCELPEPFDLVATRQVGSDCMVAFERRSYSVPFAHCGKSVEVRGCARAVQIIANAQIVATHPRHGEEQVVVNPAHFEGPSTDEVIAPRWVGWGRGLRRSPQWSLSVARGTSTRR